jgi:monofunctional biosynthetic peptidoglycan transglycosylase
MFGKHGIKINRRSVLAGGLALGAAWLAGTPARANPLRTTDKMLFDFADRSSASRWFNVDDPVMGGVSSSSLVSSEGAALFSGVVSLENNGGFASVRSRTLRPADDLRGFSALRARVKGDGKTYIFSLQTFTASRLNYWQRFETTKDEWVEVTLPLSEFVPVFRGFTPRNAPRLDTRAIANYGIYITDKQTGPFALELAWIKAIPDSVIA